MPDTKQTFHEQSAIAGMYLGRAADAYEAGIAASDLSECQEALMLAAVATAAASSAVARDDRAMRAAETAQTLPDQLYRDLLAGEAVMVLPDPDPDEDQHRDIDEWSRDYSDEEDQ